MAKVKRGQNNSETLKDSIIAGMTEKKALDIVVIDIRKLFNPLSDYLVICTATSDRHAQSISEEVEKSVFQNQEEDPWVSEGKDLNEWIILDYISVVAHIFLEGKRTHYALEELWGDGVIEKINAQEENIISE